MGNWWRFWKAPRNRAEAVLQGAVVGLVLAMPFVALAYALGPVDWCAKCEQCKEVRRG